jgi:hypothetical protein
MLELQKPETQNLSPEQLHAAEEVKELLRRPDAHLIEGPVVAGAPAETAPPKHLSQEQRAAEIDTQERLAVNAHSSPWINK